MLELGTEQTIASEQPRLTRSGRRRERRRFWAGLGLIMAGGLAGRILYVLVVTRHESSKLYDAAWYELQAVILAAGRFFPVLVGYRPDAGHPPLTSLVITPVTYA